MAQHPWLSSYPAGVPHTIDPGQYNSIVALMEEAFAKFASRDAYACMDKRMTFAELDAASKALGAWLQAKGLKKGDRVAIMMPNVLQYPICVAGILRAGYTVVNVNPLYTPRELEHQLKDSGASAIFILENFATTLQAVIAKTQVKHVVVARMGDMLGFPQGHDRQHRRQQGQENGPGVFSCRGPTPFKAVLAEGRGKTLTKPELKPSDVAFLQYTGGTTGVSKGATLLHSQSRRQHAAERGVAAAGAEGHEAGRRARHHHGAAAVSHLRADRVLPDGLAYSAPWPC